MINKTTAALTLSCFALAACSYSDNQLDWPEEGIWKCHNEFNDRSISFNTEAQDTRMVIDLINIQLRGTEIDTNLKFKMLNDNGWVCTLPSGAKHVM